jgi:hypothetical protein
MLVGPKTEIRLDLAGPVSFRRRQQEGIWNADDLILVLAFKWGSILAASGVYQPLVSIMRTYPKPVEDIAFERGERPIRMVDAGAPQPADWLQVQGRMCWVLTKKPQNSSEA